MSSGDKSPYETRSDWAILPCPANYWAGDMISTSDILNAAILIVDDMQANVCLLENMLRGAGYTRVASTMDPQEVPPTARTRTR